MVQDGGFGTYWEFTPNGGGGNDYPDLSTNYGSGPHSPPKLCGPGVDPNDCVAKAANILFNVPLAWTTNFDCSFTTKGTQIKGASCLTANCADAYQHPTDDKQVACPVRPQTRLCRDLLSCRLKRCRIPKPLVVGARVNTNMSDASGREPAARRTRTEEARRVSALSPLRLHELPGRPRLPGPSRNGRSPWS